MATMWAAARVGRLGARGFASKFKVQLPPGVIPFASPEGKRVFREALLAGGLGNFFEVAEQFHTQNDPAYCGPGTIVMALNSLGLDPQRMWKAPWRWFSEEMLMSCVPIEYAKRDGINFDEFACICEANGARARSYRADATTKEQFQKHVEDVTAQTDPVETQMVVSYSRSSLKQTGDGHYSPIGGYHKERQLVLVMDVARFKYPPHWVPLDALWEAMLQKDAETNRSRGYVLLSASSEKINVEMCDHSGSPQLHWERVKEFFAITLPIKTGDHFIAHYEQERPRYGSALEYFIPVWTAAISPAVLASLRSHLTILAAEKPSEAAEDVAELQQNLRQCSLWPTVQAVFGKEDSIRTLHPCLTVADVMFLLLVFAPVMRRKAVPAEMLDCAHRLELLQAEEPGLRRLVRRVREHLLLSLRLECCGHPHNHHHKPSCVGLLSADHEPRPSLPPLRAGRRPAAASQSQTRALTTGVCASG
uniref:glutathione gamma-glutamylcysteinyltransferase n=1 Tax=Euglena gracilis TaxID=3039 RepID=A0A075TCK5_EUGGR|nr:phytochelatin synthase [Euglena gracilis]